ncbi:RagB/SusD family nutrient uptake outer membrane protein [Chitinophaga qingshengii]|uniref:RagB/SusD family nutrient uptake outer membrane protein n=1 Tax=Chitinophaga qingshengii TaxID=1569794 RepID=A0ABR7TRP0_9BACT|nr:RagB/SusD family nutrient uptake outer membrane protein [Chitinophaga qingshengii]MBC9932658.1 RagB/SusD family nutrient uptake outer membrane protein [Chitinophaga qingshengii]
MIRYIQHTVKYLALMLPVCLLSCNKQLDLSPTDSIIDPGRTFRNVSDLNGGLLGAYTRLTYNTIYNVSLVTDECMLPSENGTGGGVASYRWQIDPGNTTITESFNEYYITIDRANRVLAALPQVPAKGDEVAQRDQYHGELLALRAYCHFQLLQSYAQAYTPSALGVPFMDVSKISSPARNTFGEVMARIEDDLKAAKKLIPADFEDNTHITLAAVSAIQARVALYEQKWSDAVTYATEAINASPLASRNKFAAIWKDAGESEVIWKLKQMANTNNGLIGGVYFKKRVALYVPSFELVKLFDKDNDVRYPAYIQFDDTRGSGKSVYLVNKYAGSNGNPGLADLKLFRTGEMYLIRAEALAELNQVADGATDLNDLRAARISGYTAETFGGKDALITAIYTERFKELAFEGQRLFDLRRRSLPVTREPEDAVNALGAVLLKPGDRGYVFPIPDAETKANKNMVQNQPY